MASKRAIENQKSRVEEYQKAESVKAKYQIQPGIQSNSGILKKLFKAIIGSSEDIDLTILGLSAIPTDTSDLRSAYLNALAKQHPDFGGKEKLLWALTASYEGLLARIGS